MAVLVCTALLAGWWGVLTIGASRHMLPGGYTLAGKQQIFIIAGVVVMLAAASVPFKIYCRMVWQLNIAALALLWLLALFGVRINGMQGWFDLGFCYLQPSEIFKCCFLLGITAVAGSEFMMGKRFWVFLLFIMAWALAIIRQPDFGTLSVYIISALLIYFAAQGEWKYLVFSCGAAALLGGAAILRYPYMANRLYGFFHPGEDVLGAAWHLKQFEMAVAEGGIWGTKMSRTMWSSGYLPLAYNDSAFATMAETLGVFGVSVYLLFFLILLLSLYSLGKSTRSSTAKLFIFGTLFMIGAQSLLHMMVNTTLLPTTGLTLPFISYGGSSLIGSFLLLGMAVSAARSK